MRLAGDDLGGRRVGEDEVDDAADRPIHGHLEPSTPSRMKSREDGLDEPHLDVVTQSRTGRLDTAARTARVPSAVASAATRSSVRFASPASALAMTDGSTAGSSRELAQRNLALLAEVPKLVANRPPERPCTFAAQPLKRRVGQDRLLGDRCWPGSCKSLHVGDLSREAGPSRSRCCVGSFEWLQATLRAPCMERFA